MNKGAKVLGLATGSTPVTLYKEMTSSDLDFSEMTSVNLDEYVGLGGSDEQSYRHFMDVQLFDKTIQRNVCTRWKSRRSGSSMQKYDQIIDAHPIDIQILGIGQNGHIGFNEPGASFDGTTSVVDLTESTINANKRFFDKAEDVPTKAVSMGIGSIMKSKEIVLMAFGESKADAIKGMIEGPVTNHLPASVLQNHDNVVVIIDEEAASKL